jgi:hypothetical protein
MPEEKADYYINADGNLVFTRDYHLKRGYCCKNGCLHCPWNYGRQGDKKTGEKFDGNEKSEQS